MAHKADVLERLDREIFSRFIANRGFSWILERMCDEYEDTDEICLETSTAWMTRYTKDVMEDLQAHFEELEHAGKAD